MNKKLLLGLGSTLILSVPILAATSCGDDGKARATGSQFLKDNTDSNKIIIRIDGSNLSTNQSDWVIKESNSNSNSNVWTLDTSKSNSSSTVYFSANKNDTKDKKFSFLCNGSEVILGVSTPLAPSGISSKGNAFQGYQGNNQNIEMNDSNKANVSISSTESLAINFEFNKNASNSSQFMKMTLPPQLKDAFEGYQGYDGNTNIKWTLKENNNSFKIENNTLSSTSAIDPASTQNITLVGTISMGEWTDTFEIKVNFSKQASDIQISSVSTKVQNDKVIVTFTGTGLSTTLSDWTISEKTTTTNPPAQRTKATLSWTIDPSSTATNVIFIVDFNKDTMGKTFTFSAQNVTGSKDVPIPTTTLTQVSSSIIDEAGNLILTFQGTNLSANLDIYDFNHKTTTTFADSVTPPTIDEAFKKKINVEWKSATEIVLTIQKIPGDGTKDALTKGLYGQTYEVNVTGNTKKSEFTFADYVAPTGVTNGIFGNSNYGPSNNNITTPLDTNAFQGNNSLTWTITVPSSTDKWVQLNLKNNDFLQSLEGQKGFGQTNNESTKLSWAVKDSDNSKFTYSVSDGLKNKEELTDTTGLNVIMVGTLTDELTGVTKTFELNLTIKIQSASTTQNVTEATSNITNEGDLTILLKGTNLSQDPTKYQFTYVPENSSEKDENVTPPTVNSSMLEVDNTVTPSDTQVQFIIKKIKQTSGNYQLPTAQTKGLYGKTFSVTSVDSLSKAKQQPVTFKFGSYTAPTALNKQIFFKDVASQSQSINSGGESQPNSFPISTEKITTPDTSKPFEYEISSEYKNFTYIYIDLPQANDILSSIEGQKGFSSSPTSSNPDNSGEEYTQVQWTLKNTTGRAGASQTNSNFELNNNLLYNKSALTKDTPVVAELTATITDQLTSESVSFNVKLTFKLGTLEDPTITPPAINPKDDITLNAGNDSAQGQNTNIELTVKGSNLPKDISQWTITDATTTPTPGGRAGKTTLIDVNNNVGNWTIKDESTEPANPGIIFTTTWSLVAGKQLNFAVDGFESAEQKFTIPSPSFNSDSSQQNKEELNKGNIEFTIKGTDLSTDAGMYKFELLSSDSNATSQAIDPAQYGITIQKFTLPSFYQQEETNASINSAIKVVIPKMIQQRSGDGTRYDVKNSTPSKISDFYGKNIKISIKNDTTKSVTCPVPGYSKPTQIQKGILGQISAGTTSNSLTQIASPSITPETSPETSPATNQPQPGRYELNNAAENLFEFTITLDKWESSYVQIGGIKDYNNKPSENGRASNDDFLSYFVGLNGFTDSAHTSLTWAFKDTPQQLGSGQQSLIDRATTANNWTLSSNGLINTTAISDETGLSTTLVGTLTDLETNKTVTFDMKVTVKKPADLKPTIPSTAPTPALEENNTKVKVTITGTNLPTDISKWTITEDNSQANPPVSGGNILAEGGDTSNNNPWSIDSSSTNTNTSVTFIANYKDVVAKKYKFALTDSPDISTIVTCPTPKYTGATAGFENNHYDIKITITGTNLPNDIEMYKFGKVNLTPKESTNPQKIDLNTLQKSIDFTSDSEVNIVFNKYNSSNNTLQTKGLYGKTSSFRFSNETEGTSHELTFPSYSLIGMKPAFLGTISTGSTHGNTPDSLSSININDDSNNSYSATITTNSSTAKYIKFKLPQLTTNNNKNNGQQSKIRRDANQPDTTTFLTNWFTGYEGFTDSARTSLTWAIDTTDTVNSAKWNLINNALTNKSGQEITVDGISVLLTATIKDTETEEQVVCKIQLTVKLGADGSGSENGGNAGGNTEGNGFVISTKTKKTQQNNK